MIIRKTRPDEYRRVNELFAICFEQPYQNCPIDPEHDDAAHWAAYDTDGEMMSSFTISDYSIQFDGHSCKMGGVGGVCTLPQYRRRGGIRACFEAALPDMYAQDYDFSYLYPFSTAYYRKFGYECCVQKFAWEIDLSLLSPPKTDATFLLSEKHRPLTDAIRTLDAQWEAHFNMMVQHTEDDYRWTQDSDPAGKQEFTYVCFDSQNTPKAYVTFRTLREPDGRNLRCNRICFADRVGFLALMQLFKSFSSDHAYVKFQTPAIPALQYLMLEWSLGAAKWSLNANAGMVRVINARRVLEKAKYLGSGYAVLDILDPQIPENNGRLAVTFENGRALSVVPTSAPADAVLTIPAFSALISGVCAFEEVSRTLSGLEVKTPNPALSQIFHRKPLMIVDSF